jgi:hypothetical protein
VFWGHEGKVLRVVILGTPPDGRSSNGKTADSGSAYRGSSNRIVRHDKIQFVIVKADNVNELLRRLCASTWRIQYQRRPTTALGGFTTKFLDEVPKELLQSGLYGSKVEGDISVKMVFKTLETLIQLDLNLFVNKWHLGCFEVILIQRSQSAARRANGIFDSKYHRIGFITDKSPHGLPNLRNGRSTDKWFVK